MILCIIRISNFTASVTNRPVCFSPAGSVPDHSAGQQNSGLSILSHGRTSYGVRVLLCGEIWYCRWACYGVYAWHGAIVGPRNCRCNRVPKLTAIALLAVSLTVYQRPTIQRPSLVTSERQNGGVTAVTHAAAWASCCISQAGTSAGWIVEKVILCIIRTPNFTVRF